MEGTIESIGSLKEQAREEKAEAVGEKLNRRLVISDFQPSVPDPFTVSKDTLRYIYLTSCQYHLPSIHKERQGYYFGQVTN